MSDLKRQYLKFMKDALRRNAELSDGELVVYMRKSNRLTNAGDVIPMIDIAKVDIVTPGRRGQGRFTHFLAFVEAVNSRPALYIENVQDERFAAFFQRRGYERREGVDACFYKMTT